jgi:heptosyltransferase-2
VEILVLHPGALGDIILSLPALEALRQSCRDPKITLAGNLDYLPLSAWGYADHVLSLSAVPIHRLYGGNAPPPGEADWWRSFARVISWTGSEDPEFAAAAAALHPAFKIGRWRPRVSEARHAARLFVDSLQPWVPCQDRIQPPAIALPAGASRRGREWLTSRGWDGATPLLAVHPGAAGPEKRWPVERFEHTLLKTACAAMTLPIVIEGPAEPGLGAGLIRRLGPGNALFAESLPLDLLAAVLSHCRSYLGNDSGISHLAAALGVATVAVFGPTLPSQWAPLGKRVGVLCDRTACGACGLGLPRGHVCLDNVGEEAVVKALAEIAGLR